MDHTTLATRPSLYDPAAFGRFVAGPPIPRARRRRIHPPHPPRADPRRPAAAGDGPHWRPFGRVRAGAEVCRLEFAVFESRPPADVPAEYDPHSRRWVAIRLVDPTAA